MFLEELNHTRINLDGKEGIGLKPTDAKNLIAINRIVVYDSIIRRMVVQVWQS